MPDRGRPARRRLWWRPGEFDCGGPADRQRDGRLADPDRNHANRERHRANADHAAARSLHLDQFGIRGWRRHPVPLHLRRQGRLTTAGVVRRARRHGGLSAHYARPGRRRLPALDGLEHPSLDGQPRCRCVGRSSRRLGRGTVRFRQRPYRLSRAVPTIRDARVRLDALCAADPAGRCCRDAAGSTRARGGQDRARHGDAEGSLSPPLGRSCPGEPAATPTRRPRPCR